MKTHPHILCINAGSSSIKFALYQREAEKFLLIYRGEITNILIQPTLSIMNQNEESVIHKELMPGYLESIKAIIAFLKERQLTDNLAVGHRVVHGGMHFHKPVAIDQTTLDKLEQLIPLAPLHQPYHIQVMKAIGEWQPGLIQIACFDTSFHRTLSPLDSTYAIPQEWTEKGYIRYGFHGLSYDYISHHFTEKTTLSLPDKTIVAHLGNGASLCALLGGRSVATTMGFTPMEGLIMGTRAGNIDPGLIFHFMNQEGMSAQEVQDMLLYQSGLKGVSGISHDMKTLVESPELEAQFAVDLYCYHVAKEMAACIPVLGGLECIIFTAGIGEHSWEVRQKICDWMKWTGAVIDIGANRMNHVIIGERKSAVKIYAMPTNEELMIAKYVAGFFNQ